MQIYILLFLFNLITIPFYMSNHKLYLFLNIIPVWALMAFRSVNVGSDTLAYSDVFYQSNILEIPMHFLNWLAPVNQARFENGFLFLCKIVYNISPDFRLMLEVTATIMISCFLFFIMKLNINYIIGILVYESMFMPFSMNVMRQALALSLCMVAFVYLMQNQVGAFCLFNFLAITMHVTAWFFLFILVYKYIKKGWKSGILIIVFMLTVSIFFDKIYDKISGISNEANSFSNLVANNNMNGLLNICYSISIMILVLIWLKHYIKVTNLDKNKLIRNAQLMLLTAIMFYILALKFSQISRIAFFFMIGYYPILSVLAGGYNMKNNRRIAFIIICAYLIINFIFIQSFRPEWSNIVPYNFG